MAVTSRETVAGLTPSSWANRTPFPYFQPYCFISWADECAVAARSIPGYSSHALDERAGEAVAGLMTVMYATRSAER